MLGRELVLSEEFRIVITVELVKYVVGKSNLSTVQEKRRDNGLDNRLDENHCISFECLCNKGLKFE